MLLGSIQGWKRMGSKVPVEKLAGFHKEGVGCFYSRKKEKGIGAHAGFGFLVKVRDQRRLDF